MEMRKDLNLRFIVPSFRKITLIGVVIWSVFAWGESGTDLKSLYKSKNYEAVLSHLETKSGKLTFKEYAYLLVSYKSLNKQNLLISSLKEAVKYYPDKDVLKRELALAHEAKANSYPDAKNFEKLQKKHHVEAVKILDDLKNKKPTAQNLTAFINYYSRQKNHTESLALLELYSRKNVKGENYYTMVCEENFKSNLFEEAERVCGELISKYKNHEKGHFYHFKSMEKLGKKEVAEKKVLNLVNRFPASADIQYEAGRTLLSKGETEEGLKHLDNHIKIAPSDEALVLKAEELFRIKKYKDSLLTYIQACKQHKEPRKALIAKIKTAGRTLGLKHPFKKSFLKEVDKCKYFYKPKRKVASRKSTY